MNIYEKNLSQAHAKSRLLAISDRRISIARFITLLATALLLYQGYQTSNTLFFLAACLSLIAFFLLIRHHTTIRKDHELTKAKCTINQDELNFLKKGDLPFDNGQEFIKTDHPYSYDLDFFGEKSLFQTINRTGTVTGKRHLAEALLTILSPKEILANQVAIQELTPQIEWRQELAAHASLKPDSKESLERLMEWSDRTPAKPSTIITWLSFIFPALALLSFGVGLFYPSGAINNFGWIVVLINLFILGMHTVSIRSELSATTKIEGILKQYAQLLQSIEHQTFQSEKLKYLQSSLKQEDKKASSAIHELALLFGRLEHVSNIFASPILNGLLLYHVHVLRGLSNWRTSYASHIRTWLDVIGEFEKFNSLANFSFNNDDFVFPAINSDHVIQFESLGHPLLPREKSVTNPVSFNENRFFILTGSNMSGKSTFLRTVGVNMVLGSIGAPVFAKKASIHPLPVLVSMRLSDSLTDSESYFYAEVKRLKYIMDQLDREPCFILLDEILRGTNSDDKRNGTMEVVRKMASKPTYGGIATHDLEVCKVSEEFPEILTNKRFEVAIVDDELVFDYKLQDGVCQNKSASFIMKKMGVI